MSSGNLMCATWSFSKGYIRRDISTDNLSLRLDSQTPRQQTALEKVAEMMGQDSCSLNRGRF